jgi:hypothetical protein
MARAIGRTSPWGRIRSSRRPTAFSPTDAMPLAPWAKIAMAVQAAISLAVLGLVVARAVNVLT